MPVLHSTPLLTPVVDRSTTLAATLLPKVVDFYLYNASWTYDDSQPADLFFPRFSC
jgi:hypothetical protein